MGTEDATAVEVAEGEVTTELLEDQVWSLQTLFSFRLFTTGLFLYVQGYLKIIALFVFFEK